VKVVIIEDEKPAARRLSRIVEQLGYKVEQLLYSVQEAVQWFLSNPHPDLILIDIQLSDGLSFEIFDEVEILSPLIFTTAYDAYTLKAFKLNSVDYLLKPIDEEELKNAIDKFRNRNTEDRSSLEAISQIKKMLMGNAERTYKKRFIVKIGQHLKMIAVEDIVCFYSENKGTYIHTSDNRDHLLDETLDEIEVLTDPAKYFRINRKYLIRIDAIQDMIAYSNNRLKLKLTHCESDDLIVSREKIKAFKNWLH
jgi:two-component system response regulator LytT